MEAVSLKYYLWWTPFTEVWPTDQSQQPLKPKHFLLCWHADFVTADPAKWLPSFSPATFSLDSKHQLPCLYSPKHAVKHVQIQLLPAIKWIDVCMLLCRNVPFSPIICPNEKRKYLQRKTKVVLWRYLVIKILDKSSWWLHKSTRITSIQSFRGVAEYHVGGVDCRFVSFHWAGLEKIEFTRCVRWKSY